MSLPERLQVAVAAWLAGRSGNRRAASAALSATYRAGGSSSGIDLGAYLVARLPATFAAVDRVLAELALRLPGFAPASLLDAGSGPGTAAWAAAARFPDIAAVTFLDNSRDFLELAAKLAEHGPEPLAAAERRLGSIESLPVSVSADLVVAAYALAELPLARAAEAAEGLWATTSKALVIVEPGTPQGFARLRLVRDRLLTRGAVPLAPCTHAMPCPLAPDDWCHFSVRLARSRAHMHAKAASVPFEDERYSYLVLAREGLTPPGARIIAPPVTSKPGIGLRLCAQGRVGVQRVARRDAAAYKMARKLDWGDLFDPANKEDTR